MKERRRRAFLNTVKTTPASNTVSQDGDQYYLFHYPKSLTYIPTTILGPITEHTPSRSSSDPGTQAPDYLAIVMPNPAENILHLFNSPILETSVDRPIASRLRSIDYPCRLWRRAHPLRLHRGRNASIGMCFVQSIPGFRLTDDARVPEAFPLCDVLPFGWEAERRVNAAKIQGLTRQSVKQLSAPQK
jgi:hypothetical protein